MKIVDCNDCKYLAFDERIGVHDCGRRFMKNLSNTHYCDLFSPKEEIIINLASSKANAVGAKYVKDLNICDENNIVYA